MKLPSNIKSKKGFWKVLPRFLNQNTAHAIYPNIYVPDSIYKNLKSKNPNPNYVSIIIHEQEHLKRIEKQGFFSWYLKYIVSPKFRYSEELEAIKPQVKFLNKKGIEFDIEKRAKQLSGYLYLCSVSYDHALKDLKKIDQK